MDERIEHKGKTDHKTCDAVSAALKIGEPTFISAQYKKANSLWRKIIFYTSQNQAKDLAATPAHTFNGTKDAIQQNLRNIGSLVSPEDIDLDVKSGRN